LGIDRSRVKAVVFDMDDTLLNWRQAEHQAIGQLALLHFSVHGIAEDRVRHVYDGVMADNFAAWKATRRWWYIQDRLKLLVERLEVHGRVRVEDLADTFTREVTARLAFLEGAEHALSAARQAGLKTAILTNGRGEVQRPKVFAFGLHTLVDFVGITGELGAWKPDLDAFRKVLDKIGVRPDHAVMVGDNEDFDITPAKALGMQTVWVAAKGGEHPDADLVVANPGELVPFLLGPPDARPAAPGRASSAPGHPAGP
jgi:putative hydrolase of the HAD superfamily